MLFRARPYQPLNHLNHQQLLSNDLNDMIALVQAAWQPQRRPDTNFHIGDLLWRLREPDYEQKLWLWEDEQGRLAGYAEWTAADRALEIQLHPDFAMSGLDREMLAWAKLQAAADAAIMFPVIVYYVCGANIPFVTWLQANGYRQQETYLNHHLRQMESEIEMPAVPEGYTVRHLQSPEEVALRVEGHRAGWQSTRMTTANYERMMRQRGYRLDLDIVVVAPDGTFAATCICWLDERNGVGLFEPVSTHPDHRRKGLGRAMMLYGMRQLRWLGASEAIVCSRSGNPAATRLYERCGMEIVRRDFHYSKQ